MTTAALSPDELEEALRTHVKGYHHQHPFHLRMNNGESTREEIRGWVANRFYYQLNIPKKDGAILSACPDREVRRRWVQRIVDHDGTTEGTGGIEAWLRLAEAVDLSRDEVEDARHLLPGVRFAVDAYVNFTRTKPWVESVASSLTELFAPDLMTDRLAAFERHYTWIDPKELTYFRTRIVQAPRDSDHGLEIVRKYCTTKETQDAAMSALSFKCDVLWSMLDAIDLAYGHR
ncbi:pyrroloquinoline-quinone synthase [Rhodococcoides trifolii]|uniref:Pyrroloquinoline-quinone synthase n=1 Tax=Rhodococcoides trifolii TaxID=908250 RepID=A0A917CW48_9NOCA|nr:pyrroloquinoline-quinone synthase PqqC [Rhodococcus trifolii]GGF99818.1 pyrroloquinoline-quinone synthase [Rhodococcus trifolii]